MMRVVHGRVSDSIEGKSKLIGLLNEGIALLVLPNPDPSAIHLEDFQIGRIGCSSLQNIDEGIVFSAETNNF